jgi:hypothetical protein
MYFTIFVVLLLSEVFAVVDWEIPLWQQDPIRVSSFRCFRKMPSVYIIGLMNSPPSLSLFMYSW